MSPRAVMLLIAYNNMDEVDGFIDHIRSLDPRQDVAFSICDNSPTPKPSRHRGAADVTTTARPDNPGYLDGGIQALAEYQRNCEMPDWVILTNTDLEVQSSNLACTLSENHDAGLPIVLAPRITEGEARIEKNPHVRQARSVTRLRVNRLLTATPVLTLAYLSASGLRHRTAAASAASAPATASPLAEANTTMFSPYGAMIIFSRAFVESLGLPKGVPLLAEEYAIAQTAALNRVPVVFEPRVHVHHVAHTTTGPGVSMRRARMLHKAFRYIDRFARSGAAP